MNQVSSVRSILQVSILFMVHLASPQEAPGMGGMGDGSPGKPSAGGFGDKGPQHSPGVGGMGDSKPDMSGMPDTQAVPKGASSPLLEVNAQMNDTVHFFLYNITGESTLEQMVLMDTNGSVPEGLWNPAGAIKIIIHGYHADYTLSPLQHLQDHRMPLIAEEYAKANTSLNVIIAEWSALAIRLAYPISAENTKYTGKAVANLLLALKNNSQFQSWEDVHIIGFSLGSHAAGVAGYHVQQMSEGEAKVGRITGLDPAGPLFDTDLGTMPNDTTGFLETSDANFVDIIHCNAGFLHWTAAIPEGRLGSNVQAGHADFYPNGGITQFQCTGETDKIQGCSHRCCVFFYAYSITRPTLACPCNGWDDFTNNLCACNETTGEYMGDPCRSTASGKYFLAIHDQVNLTTIARSLQQLAEADPEEAAKHASGRIEAVSGVGRASTDVDVSRPSTNLTSGGIPSDPVQHPTGKVNSSMTATPEKLPGGQNMTGKSMGGGASIGNDTKPDLPAPTEMPKVPMSGNNTKTPLDEKPKIPGGGSGKDKGDEKKKKKDTLSRLENLFKEILDIFFPTYLDDDDIIDDMWDRSTKR